MYVNICEWNKTRTADTRKFVSIYVISPHTNCFGKATTITNGEVSVLQGTQHQWHDDSNVLILGSQNLLETTQANYLHPQNSHCYVWDSNLRHNK